MLVIICKLFQTLGCSSNTVVLTLLIDYRTNESSSSTAALMVGDNTISNIRLFEILNPEVFHFLIGSKVTAIMPARWIWPIDEVVFVRVCDQRGYPI